MTELNKQHEDALSISERQEVESINAAKKQIQQELENIQSTCVQALKASYVKNGEFNTYLTQCISRFDLPKDKWLSEKSIETLEKSAPTGTYVTVVQTESTRCHNRSCFENQYVYVAIRPEYFSTKQ